MQFKRPGWAASSLRAPLISRTTWGNFEYKMHKALEIDVSLDLGEMTRTEWEARQRTLILPAPGYDDPTVASVACSDYWFYLDDTSVSDTPHVDAYATEPMKLR
jgi:hypothetical protein